MPQLFGSSVVSTHVTVAPEAHITWDPGHWQAPPLQVPSPSQVAPSLGELTHVPVVVSQAAL
jgi:hypothetical protein